MPTSRQQHVLNLVAESYIATARPVPSSWVAGRLNVSSATVRNDYSALEDAGLLQRQHVSSGRVPTSRGLGAYARTFIPPGSLPRRQRLALTRRLSRHLGDSLLENVALVAAELSGYAVVVRLPPDRRLRILQVHLGIVSSERLLAVVVLENGLVRQHAFALAPMPGEEAVEEAEGALRHLSVPLSDFAEATAMLARHRSADIARILNAVSAAAPEFAPRQLFTHGLGNLFQEPEAQDPEFLRTALSIVEAPAPGEPGDLELFLDDSTARVRAALPVGSIRAELCLVGPARMRYPETLRLAGGIADVMAGGELPADQAD